MAEGRDLPTRILRTPDGRVRAPWRLVVFGLLFYGLLVGAALLWSATVQSPGTRSALLAQGFITLAAALGAGILSLRLMDGRSGGALGFAPGEGVVRETFGGVAVGTGMLLLVAVGLLLGGLLRFRPDVGGPGALAGELGLAFLALAVPAAAEEALFRGYPFQVLVEMLGPVAATVLASGLFALAHANNPDVGLLALVNIFLAGVLLSAVYLRSRSLWAATGVHLGWNWAMAGLDLPVSGLDLVDAPLYDAVVAEPAWLTGGAFGPEGGLVGTVAFAVGFLAVMRMAWFRQPERLRRLRPIVNRWWEGGEGQGSAGSFRGPSHGADPEGGTTT